MGDENTMMPYCIECNKFITIDNILFHSKHNVGKKSFKQVYDDAMHDSGFNR